jgi:hypothetical protein
MKRHGRLVGLAIVLAAAGAAGCDDNPAAPSDTNTLVFTAQMTAANEVPPVAGAEASATGSVRVTVDATRDANGVITGGTAQFIVNMAGFPAGTTAIAAHIHEGAPGIAGPVRIGIPTDLLSATTPITMTNGTATNVTYTVTLSTAAHLTAINAMLTNPNGYYFNVHTPANPGGAVRGPMVKL